ncbi:DinB family protein [Alkalibacillus almallahensis]|uniref:DinB family protein n=1 Tax=Alkalibacillus almallahensis TaxID=1379154 RepID=UPI00141E7C7D|nr:DinB family protein [Alkalibacillus almallahensis]NIK11475.1 putative damage-inducible protein DinB [Alkalibacillus almallahensis]
MIDYRIKNIGDFSPKIGELASMLEHTRAVTLQEIKDLSEKDLDYLVEESSNTIGSLLLHIASIEFVHQVISFENRDINEAELKKWKSALVLGDDARKTINKNTINYYIDELSKVREKTLTRFKELNDDWLYEEKKWENGVPYNNYFLWFHVFEDEISHRGQIRMIKRMLPKN